MFEIITVVLVAVSTIGLIVNWIVKKENAELKSDFDTKNAELKSDFDKKFGFIQSDFDKKFGFIQSDFDKKFGFMQSDFDKKIGFMQADFDKKNGFMQSALNNIVTALENSGIKVKRPYFKSESPKKITERGYELLNKLNVESYLDAHCDLLTDKELKNKTDVDIFIKSYDWVKEKGQKKAFELRFNSDMNQEQNNELLALFILDKIKKQAP